MSTKPKRRPIEPVALTPTDGKVRPYTVLTVYESESSSWKYEIRVSHSTGIRYCTCLGWRFHKRCTHLDDFNSNPVFVNGTADNAPATDLAQRAYMPGPEAPAEALRAALADRNIHITAQVAQNVAQRVLEAAGAMVATAVPAAPKLRAGQRRVTTDSRGVRVVILPD